MTVERPPASRDSTVLVLLALAFVVWGMAVLYLPAAHAAAIPTAYATPLVLILALILALRILSCGTQPVPYGLLIAGCSFVVGGAAFDIFATVVHSPDLALETNPIARLLLDSGHSTRFVYVYAGFCQFAFALLICLLWAGLLRHRKSIVHSVRDCTGPMQIFKALTGGARLTWRQWLCPLRLADLPDFSTYVWVLTVMWVAGAAYRWYLGLEWFGFSPVDRLYVGVITPLAGIAAYVAWVYRAAQRASGESPASASPQCAVSE